MPARPSAALAVFWSLAAAVATAEAQPSPLILRTSGDHFTVNGTPRFLLFVSYYDGTRASTATLDSDFAYLKKIGIDGIRILPNWSHYGCLPDTSRPASDDALFTVAGTLRESRWPALVNVLDRAAAHGLLVDVTFTRDTLWGPDTPPSEQLSPSGYGKQIREVARRLSGSYPHVLFDIDNEYDEHGLTDAQVAGIAAGIRAEDPLLGVRRVITISTGGTGQDKAGAIARTADLSFAAPHDAREPSGNWYTLDGLADDLKATLSGMGAPRRPVHFQEPMPFARFDGACTQIEDRTPTRHRNAAANAKRAGVAAWTFHTRTTFALHNGSYLAKLGRDPDQKTELEALRGAADNASWGIAPPPPQ